MLPILLVMLMILPLIAVVFELAVTDRVKN
jgi:hypothetical protein